MWDQWKIIVEIDGAQHAGPLQRWDDVERDNKLSMDGYRTLRFPAWRVRNDSEDVAREILKALRRQGYPG